VSEFWILTNPNGVFCFLRVLIYWSYQEVAGEIKFFIYYAGIQRVLEKQLELSIRL
jgi:hypothetical protein